MRKNAGISAAFGCALMSLLVTFPAFAQGEAMEPPPFDSGDTAWMLVSSLLVLMMTVPGLALFYGGLVKKDNVLATLMQSMAVCAIVSVIWPVIGYTLAFTPGNGLIGSLDKTFLSGVNAQSAIGTIPETVFIMFQMTFAIITTALLVGAVADRIKFTSLMIFTPLWVIVVYAPIAHWVWGEGGFLGGVGLPEYTGFFGMGKAIDFAGGTVVHINSGVAGLVAAIVVGRSIRTNKDLSTSTNLTLSVIGAGLLWVGWFGFNAGSALTAGASAGYAMLVTNSAAGTAATVWMLLEVLHKGKVSVQGTLSGLVAGLVAITPAAGFVDFGGSMIIGMLSALLCYVSVEYLKSWLGYDDSLDVFGLHGVGGIVGAVLTGILANPSIGGVAGALYGGDTQLMAQILSIIAVAAYSGLGTFVVLVGIRSTIGLRVDPRVEYHGLDLALHGQTAVEYDREVRSQAGSPRNVQQNGKKAS